MTTPVSSLPGVGEKRAALFASLGLHTVEDLLFHFPRAYQHRGNVKLLSEAEDGETASFLLTVATEPQTAQLKNRMTLTKFAVIDESRKATVIYFNQNYVARSFHVGQTFRFWGKLRITAGQYELASPDYELYREEKPLPEFYPIYPLTAGLTQKFMQATVRAALHRALQEGIVDRLPDALREKYRLCTLEYALKAVHEPACYAMLEQGRAYFVFEELFLFSLGIGLSKRRIQKEKAPVLRKTDETGESLAALFFSRLPYTPTNAQRRVIGEISDDVTRPDGLPMSRIVVGDVGSGKTVCAAAAAFFAGRSGYQAALMVPTSILARQHYDDLAPLFEELGLNTALLIGSMKQSEKNRIRTGLEDGRIDFVIGTHALLSEGVHFQRLGLVITDEQHRFGVRQREILAHKQAVPTATHTKSIVSEQAEPAVRTDPSAPTAVHVLVMSATPIPRTLAIALYGDLDMSTLDELPPGRQKVDTFVVDESYRQRLNGFIRRNVSEGRQVYVVCPSIEAAAEDEEEGGEVISFGYGYDAEQILLNREPVKNAVEWVETLRGEFPDLSVGLMHGKMKDAEKEAVMRDFSDNKVQILVSTTVIEVGVNVPNATLMIVENAERFGLSQLHQLRGRVGRGRYKSWCILVSNTDSETAKKRLAAMHATGDGFQIAEQDLMLRGPGDFFPTETGENRQHGGLKFRIAALCDDMKTLEAAFAEAAALLKEDPALSAPEHIPLKKEILRLFGG